MGVDLGGARLHRVADLIEEGDGDDVLVGKGAGRELPVGGAEGLAAVARDFQGLAAAEADAGLNSGTDVSRIRKPPRGSRQVLVHNGFMIVGGQSDGGTGGSSGSFKIAVLREVGEGPLIDRAGVRSECGHGCHEQQGGDNDERESLFHVCSSFEFGITRQR